MNKKLLITDNKPYAYINTLHIYFKVIEQRHKRLPNYTTKIDVLPGFYSLFKN